MQVTRRTSSSSFFSVFQVIERGRWHSHTDLHVFALHWIDRDDEKKDEKVTFTAKVVCKICYDIPSGQSSITALLTGFTFASSKKSNLISSLIECDNDGEEETFATSWQTMRHVGKTWNDMKWDDHSGDTRLWADHTQWERSNVKSTKRFHLCTMYSLVAFSAFLSNTGTHIWPHSEFYFSPPDFFSNLTPPLIPLPRYSNLIGRLGKRQFASPVVFYICHMRVAFYILSTIYHQTEDGQWIALSHIPPRHCTN